MQSCKSSWIAGQWEGLGQEQNGNTWAVNIEAQSPKDIIISYPSAATDAEWYYSFTNSGQMVFIELSSFEEGEIVYIVLVNRITDDILELKYFSKDQFSSSPSFTQDNLVATAMVKRCSNSSNLNKATSNDYIYTPPKPIKIEKAVKYKIKH